MMSEIRKTKFVAQKCKLLGGLLERLRDESGIIDDAVPPFSIYLAQQQINEAA